MQNNLITSMPGPAVIGFIAQEPRTPQPVRVKRPIKAWGQWQ
jgi:hypothetical protein